MTSSQETERVHSYNPGARTGRGCTVPMQKFVCDSVTLIAVLHFTFHFILQVYNSGESDSPWLYVCVTHLTLHLLILLSVVFGPRVGRLMDNTLL